MTTLIVPSPKMEELVSDKQLRPDLIALLVLAAGLGLRVQLAVSHFFNADEALHYWIADQSYPLSVYRESLNNAHPPLYFLSIYYWRLLGNSDLMLRMLPILASIGFLWFLYKWTTAECGPAAGLCALAVAACSPSLV